MKRQSDRPLENGERRRNDDALSSYLISSYLEERVTTGISWQFYGAAILQFFINYQTIPSFWHFGLASGLNSLFGEYQIVREAIAKQAATNILSAAGFSLSGGAQSRSVSRDGVSDNRTYAGKQAGAELRAQYEEWLTGNVRRIGQRYGGVSMAIL